jgi:hypothetical protein
MVAVADVLDVTVELEGIVQLGTFVAPVGEVASVHVSEETVPEYPVLELSEMVEVAELPGDTADGVVAASV